MAGRPEAALGVTGVVTCLVFCGVTYPGEILKDGLVRGGERSQP